MKFISSFIKHSLQPARKGNAEFYTVSQVDQKLQTKPYSETLNQSLKTDNLPDQRTANTAALSATETIQNINQPGVTAQDVFGDKIDTPAGYDCAVKLPSEHATLNSPVADKFPLPSNSTESEIKTTQQSQSPALQDLDIVNKPQQVQMDSADLQQGLNEIVSSSYPDQQHATDPANLSINRLATTESHSQETGLADQFSKIDNESNPQKTNFTNETALHTTGTNRGSDIPLNKQSAVAIPLAKEATMQASLKEASAQAIFPVMSRPTETPQVRIGNINILIDDQAATKPTVKPASTPASPTIAFGLRGL